MKKFDYKWVIAILCFLMVFITLGFCSSCRSLYVVPVCDAFGIRRSAFSINDTCRYIATSITNMFFGSLVARFGMKKLIITGFFALIASSLVYFLAPNIYFFYLGGILLGFGLSFTTTTMVGAVINRFFKKNKGTVMGTILASNGIGAAIATQIISPIIYNSSDPFSYRKAYLLTAIILAVTTLIIMFFLKERPQDELFLDTKSTGKKSRGESWVGIPYSTLVKKAYFYCACVCIFLAGIVMQGTCGVTAAHFNDIGIDAGYIALMLSAHSLILSGAKFLIGFIYDRVGLRKTTSFCFVCAFLFITLLLFSSATPFGRVLAMSCGIFSSLALPLETIMLPIYAGDLFGQKSFNKVLGIFVSINTAGYALGSVFVNLFHDIFGTYNIAFIICGILILLSFTLMQFVITTSHNERKNIEAEIKG